MGNTKVKNITTIAAAICLLGSGAFAGTSGCYTFTGSDLARGVDNSAITCTLPGGGSRYENQAFVGIVLTMNKGEVQPKVSAGLRRILVQGNDHVTGAEINFTTAPSDLGNTTLHLVGLAGKRDVMANIGLGYNVADNNLLVNGGVQVPYLRAFVDYNPKTQGLTPQFEVNSYGKIAAAGPGCAGDILAPGEIRIKLADDGILFNGNLRLYAYGGGNGNIYDGRVYDMSFMPYEFIGTMNDAVYDADGATCLTVPVGTKVDID